MTAISPLQSIHKKGLFGDHHKKDEHKLLKISEVKDLKVVQIVQYKKSKVQLNSVQVDSLEFPCLLYTSPSPRDGLLSRMPSSA